MPDNNMSSKAYIALEELLVTLELEPAKTYSEKELMDLVDISRTPLREALLRLSNESLIKIIPRRGIEISDINMANQLSILETRRVLDTLLISRATRHATSFEKEKIRKFKDLILLAVRNKDAKEYLKVDKQLDQIIFAAAKNEFAKKATNPLHIRSRRFWYYFKGPEDLSKSARIHIKLIDAIINSKEEKAIAYSNEIIDSLVNVVRKHINFE